MTDSKRRSQEPDETTITKLGKQTQADIYVVRHLYDEELEILRREAAVRGFIGVIAARPVKQRLPAGAAGAHPQRPANAGTDVAQAAARPSNQLECSHGHSERTR